MALIKSSDELARLFKVPEDVIRRGNHYASVSGALVGVIEAFMEFVDDVKDIDTLKALVHASFDQLMREGAK